MKKLLILFTGILLVCSNSFAEDVAIDGSGNLTTGTSNSYGNLKVTGASGEHAVAGEASGTGAAGAYGKNTDNNNYGALGTDEYGVYGNSSTGTAGHFAGDARVTGDLTVEGTISGESDPTVAANVKDGVDWSELSGIPAGFADGTDNTGGGSGTWTESGSDIYYNSGSVGVGTDTPAGNLDVNGSICLTGDCRTSWPTGSGSGAFTDTGSVAHYTGGNVGIGTASPVSLGSTDTRVLHLKQSVALNDYTAAGIRLEVEGQVMGGISSSYSQIANEGAGEGGVFVGALTDHRLGFITNSMEKMTLSTAGYLGIDTTLPLQPLHVQGNAYISDALGIGTDSPTSPLHVSGSDALMSSGTGDFRLFLSKNQSSDFSSLIFQNGDNAHAEIGLTGDNNFHIKVSPDGNTLTDLLFINAEWGTVGIGTLVPEYGVLNVLSQRAIYAIYAENDDTGQVIYARKSGSGDAVHIRNTGTGYGLLIQQVGSNHGLVIKDSTGSELMLVESSGKVGIGTATPQGTLDVNGSIYQRGAALHADYVFELGYQLETIEDHADFMWNNKHLKSIPKATVDNKGREIVELGAHRKGIVEELEKAHIYIDMLHNQINEQNKIIQLMEDRLTKLEATQ